MTDVKIYGDRWLPFKSGHEYVAFSDYHRLDMENLKLRRAAKGGNQAKRAFDKMMERPQVDRTFEKLLEPFRPK